MAQTAQTQTAQTSKDNPLIFDCQFQLVLGRLDLSVDLQSSQPVMGLFGISGSGKTSILHTIAGLNAPKMAVSVSMGKPGLMAKKSTYPFSSDEWAWCFKMPKFSP